MMAPVESRITVNEVWHLALPPGTVLAGGAAGLNQRVEWVTSLRPVFPLFGTLGQGYMALARIALARGIDSRLTPGYLLQELHRVHASALAIDEEMSAEDTALADELGLPVFLLPAGTDQHEVERAILRTLVDREGQLARREVTTREMLLGLFAHGGVQAILDELSRFTSGFVAIVEKSDVVVAQAGSGLPVGASSERMVPITVAGRPLGHLVLRANATRSNPLDEIYARQVAEIAGIDMLERQARQEAEERMGADLVELLLDETRAQEAVAARFQRLGYDPADTLRHVVISLQPTEEQPSLACLDVARDVLFSAKRDGTHSISALYRGYLLVFCAFPLCMAERRVREWLQDALAHGAGSRCLAGVSRVVEGIPGLREAVGEAVSAVELGQRIAGRQSPFYYEEMGLYRLLAALRGRDELWRFYDESLGALVRYDQAHGSELVRTLQMFFEQNANATQTARSLYVHRNTLNYRMQRIVEITGLDLNDAEARLALQLALQVHRLYG
ncbi:MAG: helix-turn-helix domain-containing protein [Anaerolineae bacterium]